MLKIGFVDFWGDGWDRENNYFTNLLRTKYEVKIDQDDPDLLFFTVGYGGDTSALKYKNHRCKKIFYTGENVRPNLDGPDHVIENNMAIVKSDLAISFDFSNDERNYRFPLWAMYIDWFNSQTYGNPEYIIPVDKISNNKYIDTPKSEFCGFVFSNPIPMRLQVMQALNQYKQVHGYGKPFGNWNYGESKKYETLSKYKFSVCVENSISPTKGYYTEKLFHAKTAGTIPIYWSDDKCEHDFNKECFLNLNDYENIEHLVEDVIKIDKDEELYQEIFNQPLFKNNQIPDFVKPESVLRFIEGVI